MPATRIRDAPERKTKGAAGSTCVSRSRDHKRDTRASGSRDYPTWTGYSTFASSSGIALFGSAHEYSFSTPSSLSPTLGPTDWRLCQRPQNQKKDSLFIHLTILSALLLYYCVLSPHLHASREFRCYWLLAGRGPSLRPALDLDRSNHGQIRGRRRKWGEVGR